MVFALTAAVVLGYEAVAIAHPQVPTISTLVRKLPIPARLVVAVAAGLLLADHFTAEVLP